MLATRFLVVPINSSPYRILYLSFACFSQEDFDFFKMLARRFLVAPINSSPCRFLYLSFACVSQEGFTFSQEIFFSFSLSFSFSSCISLMGFFHFGLGVARTLEGSPNILFECWLPELLFSPWKDDVSYSSDACIQNQCSLFFSTLWILGSFVNLTFHI